MTIALAGGEGGGAPRPRRALEARLAEQGATALFYGAIAAAAVARLGRGQLELADFSRRIVGEATIDGRSIDGRIRLYALAALAAISGAGAALLLARAAERLLSPHRLRILSATSVAGCALLALRLFGFAPESSVLLVLALHGLVVASALAERALGAERLFADPAAQLAWQASSAAALLAPLFELARGRFQHPGFAAAAWILGCGGALELALLLAQRRARSAIAERIAWASVPLSALALVPFARDELVLLATSRGLPPLRPIAVELALSALVLAWIAWRFRRARKGAAFELARSLGRLGFPLLFAGASTLARYRPFLDPPNDFLEPANVGLTIQQWVDFGRLPFVETFDVHGAWESAWGGVYALLSGFPHELWQFYDFGKYALPFLLLYAFVRRASGSSYVALFAAGALPFADGLAPAYCAPALAGAFALHAALERRSFRAWLALAATLALLVAWRIDIGAASIAASLLAVIAQRALVPGPPMHLGRALAALVVVGVTVLALWCALCAAARVDPLARLRDLAHVVQSNQGYGHSRLAPAETEAVRFHLYVVPFAVALVAVDALLRRRRAGESRGALDGRVAFLSAGLLFLAGYYFANVPRGLVRHTFFEQHVYLASFGALAVALWPYLRFGDVRPKAALAGFAAIGALALLAFPPTDPRPRPGDDAPRSLWQEVLQRLPARRPVDPESPAGARDAVPADFAARHFAELARFLDANLATDETFLDLSYNPMLYVYTHRRSPHWLNHLMCAPDDYAQERVLEELERFDVPLVVMAQDRERARAAGLRWIGDELDGVPFRLRHYRLFEHVYEHYRPLAYLGRWEVWARDDWTLRAPPGEEVTRVDLARDGGARVLAGAPLALETENALFLRVEGASDAPVSVHWRVRDVAGEREEARELRFDGAGAPREALLELALEPGELETLRVELAPANEAARVALVERADDGYARMAQALRATEVTRLGELAWIWARFDEHAAERRVAATLFEAGDSDRARDDELGIRPRSDAHWERGVSREGAGVVLDAPPPDLRAGEVLEFAASGPRAIARVLGRQVLLDGAPLDPAGDGAPHAVLRRSRSDHGRIVRADERFELPLPVSRASMPEPYLLVRVANPEGRAQELVVEHGEGERTEGRFVLLLRPNEGETEYCIRASAHRSWWRRRGGWIAFTPRGGMVELAGAALAEGE